MRAESVSASRPKSRRCSPFGTACAVLRRKDRQPGVHATVVFGRPSELDRRPELVDGVIRSLESLPALRAAVFEEDMHLALSRRLELRKEVAVALDAEGFELHFRSIMDLASGEVCGAQALLRCDHPPLGVTMRRAQ